jgi:hypothetical protein
MTAEILSQTCSINFEMRSKQKPAFRRALDDQRFALLKTASRFRGDDDCWRPALCAGLML